MRLIPGGTGLGWWWGGVGAGLGWKRFDCTAVTNEIDSG